MELYRLKQWIGLMAERSERMARIVSGEGEAAEICRQIEAKLDSLLVRPMATAPRDGSKFLLVTRSGIISARYDKGHGWLETQDGKEYWGPQWDCCDDAVTIEIEETPEGEICDEAVGWLPLPDTSEKQPVAVPPPVDGRRQRIEEILSPALDVCSPYAKQMIDALVELSKLTDDMTQLTDPKTKSSLDETRSSFGHKEDHP